MPVTTAVHSTDRYAQLTIERPGAKNALSSDVLADIQAALDNVESQDDIRAVVLTGSGDVFSAGADIHEFSRHTDDPDALASYLRSFKEIYDRIEAFPLPVVAALNGPAHGGGAELAMCCDLRVAATSAEIKLSEITMALIPPFERLSNHLSDSRVRELCYTGNALSAKEGVKAGVFVDAVAPEDLEDRIESLVADIVDKSSHALAQTKEALQYSDGKSTGDSIEHRYALNYECFSHDDFEESVTAFAEGREPDYS